MKAATLLLGLLFVALGLAVVPNASAEIPLPTDIPYCVTPDCEPVACVMAPCGPHDAAPDAPSCKPVDRYDGGIHTTVSSDCRTQVDIKTYDCVWNCGWHDVVRTPYLTIRHYGQDNGEASSSAAAIELPGPCGPTAYCTGPECPAVDVSTTDFFAYLGPHAGVATTSDCQANVPERGLRWSPPGAGIDAAPKMLVY